MSKTIDPHIIGNHIRELRLKRQVSVRSFAEQTGFSPSFISHLENGKVSPSLGSLQRIAETLHVSLGEFFVAAASRESNLIIRSAERQRLDSTWTDAHLEVVGVMARSRKLETVIAVFGPGGKSGKHPHSHEHEEFAFVVKGSATLTLGEEEHVLEAGDSVTLPARIARRWENHSDEVVEILIVAARNRA